MKRIILFLSFTVSLFGGNSCGLLYVLDPTVSPNPVSNVVFVQNQNPSGVNQPLTTLLLNSCQTYPNAKQVLYVGTSWRVNPNNPTYYDQLGDKYSLVYTPSCPSGTSADSNGICRTATACSWATNPPWYPVLVADGREDQCNNAYKLPSQTVGQTGYTWNFSWCSSNNKCYGREYYCPKGQVFDANSQECRKPIEPPLNQCPWGYVFINGGSYVTSSDGTISKVCWEDQICKRDPTVNFRVRVSCGAGSVDGMPETNPNAPTIPDVVKPKTTFDQTAKCGTEKMMAQASCLAPKILSFQCDPVSGNVIKSTCTDPVTPSQTPVNSGDDVAPATTSDIKTLGNTLPEKIKEAITNFFSDGSMPHLESIRGSLEALNILHADSNDKLDSISATADASLVLQSETNSRLDDLKSTSSGIQNTLSSMADGGTYTGESMPSPSDLSPDGNSTSGFDVFMNSFTQIKGSFDDALTSFESGFTPPVIQGGSCPSYSFYGHQVSIASIGQSIQPYSGIFSILVYIGLMFGAFRLVFSFFTKGV